MINIDKEVALLKNDILEIRRVIHQMPEKGFEEYQTSKYIKNKLSEYGIDEVHDFAKTGVVGLLKGSKGKKTTAFRADMDGLPVCENTNLAYKSKKEGFMHACGHDGHMAAVLGLAKYAAQNRYTIHDNLIFIFQPAEEGPGGAEVMIKEGIIEKYHIDRIIGMHIFPEYPQGKVASRSGALMARNGEINITVKGQKAHGAMPHKGVDAIVIAANLITAFQSIVSRNINAMESAVLTIGKIQGGEAENIIADEVRMNGTMRAFSDDVYNKLVQRILEISKGLEQAYTCNIDIDFNHMYRIVNNDPFLEQSLKKAVGADNYIQADLAMVSEDFSFYQQRVPGLFFFLGSLNEEKGYTYPLHSGKFNFDEEILVSAIQTYLNLLKEI